MTTHYTKIQTIAAVPGLSDAQLAAYMAADLVVASPDTPDLLFRPIDIARLTLLCDLADQFDLDTDALGVVMGLIDQLHDARLRLFAMAKAIEPEPQDLRHRVGARFAGILAV